MEFPLLKNIIIMGSGVGGATVAKELATKGHKVTILEKGKYHKLGTTMRALKFYSGSLLCPAERTPEGTEIIRTIMVGGSSMVTLANGVRALEKELRAIGINLKDEFEEAEKETGVTPTQGLGGNHACRNLC